MGQSLVVDRGDGDGGCSDGRSGGWGRGGGVGARGGEADGVRRRPAVAQQLRRWLAALLASKRCSTLKGKSALPG